ncbi:MAG: hypothetical protein J6M92_02255 [Oribacterium sp.]|nr:hypothetical protein [Oribacterium sp.]
MSQFQVEAEKTIDRYLFNSALENHALMGLAAQIGKLSEYNMKGRNTEESDLLKKECLENVLYYVAEMSASHNWSMEDLAEESLKRHGVYAMYSLKRPRL